LPNERAQKDEKNAQYGIKNTSTGMSKDANKGLSPSVSKKPRPVGKTGNQTKGSGYNREYRNYQFVHIPKLAIIGQKER
jgi:hypothetical protein